MTANGYTGATGGGGGSGAVDSVNGRTGAVVLTKTDVGLASVDNTSDANKPVSTATSTALGLKADSSAVTTALALKADLASPALTGNPTAPTQTAGNNTTRLATTAFVTAAVAAGGGGGASVTVVRNTVQTGDIVPALDAAWTVLSAGLGTWTIPAVVGDEVEINVGCMIQDNTSSFYEVVSLDSGGSIARFGSTGTSTPSAAGEGDPVLYPNSGFNGQSVTMGFTVASGDLNAGNVTFCMAHKGAAAGKLFASANYPLRYRMVNFG